MLELNLRSMKMKDDDIEKELFKSLDDSLDVNYEKEVFEA